MNTELLIGGSILAVLIFALIIYVGKKDSNLPKKQPETIIAPSLLDPETKKPKLNPLSEDLLLAMMMESQTSNQHLKSIATNVRFFAWLTVISLIVWLIALAAN